MLKCMPWTLLRISILVSFTILMAGWVLRLQLSPRDRTAVNPGASEVLPSTVVLQEWQFQSSQQLPPSKDEAAQWVAGRRYHYQYQNDPLTLEMRYLKNTGVADVRVWLNHNTTSSIDLEIRQQPSVGYYGISADQQQAYLTACIPPRGLGVVTANQFQQNLYQSNTHFDQFLNWLLGRSRLSLLDDRCLWAYLFTPRVKTSEDAYIVLENAWVSWFQWWSQNFPQPIEPIPEVNQRS